MIYLILLRPDLLSSMSLSVLILAALLRSVHSTEGTVEKLTLRYDKRTVGYLYLTEDHDNIAISKISALFPAGSGATGSGPVANAARAKRQSCRVESRPNVERL